MDRKKRKIVEEFWLKKLAGDLPKADLPLAWGETGSHRDSFSQVFSQQIVSQLESMSKGKDVALFVLVFAALHVALYKYTGLEDLVVAVPAPGGENAGEMLLCRTRLSPELTLRDTLTRVKETVLEAFKYCDYSYDEMIRKLSIREGTLTGECNLGFAYDCLQRESHNLDSLALVFRLVRQDRDLHLQAHFYRGRYLPGTIERFCRALTGLLENMPQNLETGLTNLAVISPQEREQMLVEFNKTRVDFSARDKPLHQVFRDQVQGNPHGCALMMGNRHLSYKELDRISDRWAGKLQSLGVKSSEILGVMMERSPEMVAGLLAVLKTGAAYLPLDAHNPPERNAFILRDCNASLLLTAGDVQLPGELSLGPWKVHSLTDYMAENPVTELSMSPGPGPAYVIYTSGSSGKPKGVALDHPGLVNLLSYMSREYQFHRSTRLLLKTPYVFDVSLSELFGWFWQGGSLAIMAPGEHREPQKILEDLAGYGISHVNFVPSMFKLFLAYIGEGKFLHLPALNYIFLAGEALTPSIVSRFYSFFDHVRLENLYGPSEATVYSSRYSTTARDELCVPIGEPLQNSKLYILDKNLELLPLGVAGELFIQGRGLARGYVNKPEMTAEKFLDSPFEPGQILYKTGDLARRLPGGDIEFLGRLDHQVKIRGNRIELGEIEQELGQYPGIGETLVLAREDAGGDLILCAYYTGGKVTTQELTDYLSRELPNYMIPAFFLHLEQFPLNTSGKIDRHRLPEPMAHVETPFTAPRDELERELAQLWRKVLFPEEMTAPGEKAGYGEPTPLGIDHNFFEMGGHSLKAALLTASVHKKFHVQLTLGQVFQQKTIRRMAEYINQAGPHRFTPLGAVEKREYYPLTPSQKRIFILDSMERKSTNYNMPQVFLIPRTISREKLQSVFISLLERHESFRTSFEMIDELPFQRIRELKPGDFELELFEPATTGLPDAPWPQNAFKSFFRPFELSLAPLVRAGLAPLAESDYLLMLDMHHIIADGVSLALFKKELIALYHDYELPQLRVQYKDYAQWIHDNPGQWTSKRDYWMESFQDEVPLLSLPLDFPRPRVQSYRGHRVGISLDRDETGALKTLALQNQVSLFMVIAALLGVLLGKLSSKEDLVVGTPALGRGHSDLENIIGLFVNTLAIRSFPKLEKGFIQYLEEMSSRVLAAFDNQDYPFEELVEQLALPRDAGRNPLFDVMLLFEDQETPGSAGNSLTLTPYPYVGETVKFDLTLAARVKDDCLRLTFIYCTRLFKEETMTRFARYFKELTGAVLKEPGQCLGQLEMVPGEEKRQILEQFNQGKNHYKRNLTLSGMFEKQSEKHPYGIALSQAGGLTLTYGYLNLLADRLAHFLVEKGLVPGEIAALEFEPSVDMMTAILAVLKTGSPYLPLNPDNPGERNRYMWADSGASFQVNSATLRDFHNRETGTAKPGLKLAVNPESTAYIIYTSGSTGKPKGVPISHANLSPLLDWGSQLLDIGPGDRVVQNLSYYFDWSVWESFIALGNGATLVIPRPGLRLDSPAYAAFMQTHRVTVLHTTPSSYRALISGEQEKSLMLDSLTHLCLGAEKLTVGMVKSSLETIKPGCRIFNMYGPTEATIITAVQEVSPDSMERYEALTSIPIGPPAADSFLLVLDRAGCLCPVNVPGELVIAGPGLAHGYLNNPELTAQGFFLDNPGKDLEKSEKELFYRTGDLARWLPGGELEFLGRMDQQVKIRGYRIEPGEIEKVMEEQENIAHALVVPREIPGMAGEEFLCAYVVLKQGVTMVDGELQHDLARQLPDYMIPAVILPIDSVPLNANGKVNLKALPMPGKPGGGDKQAGPRDALEKELAVLWSTVLYGNGENGLPVNLDDNFFQMGGHSLKGALLAARINKQFDTQITLADIFKYATLRKMAQHIKETGGGDRGGIESVEKREYYPLSYNQKRLWFIYQQEPESPAFNMPEVVNLPPGLQIQVLRETLDRLVKRHESLRTSFAVVQDEPVQVIHDQLTLPGLEEIDISGLAEEDKQAKWKRVFKKESLRLFVLEKAPLFHAGLVKTGQDESRLIFTMHHILSDGWSMDIFKAELLTIYRGLCSGNPLELKSLAVQYKDFCLWHSRLLQDQKAMAPAQDFWSGVLETGVPQLNLPRLVNSDKKNLSGAFYRVFMPRDVLETIQDLSRAHGTTLFAVLFSSYLLALSRYTNQEDISCSIISAGRDHEAFLPVMGFFVNSLLFVTQVESCEGFSDFMSRVHGGVLDCIRYQHYPLEIACAEKKIRYPELSVAFNLVNTRGMAGSDKVSEIEPFEAYHQDSNRHVKFDLEPYVVEYDNGISITWAYKESMFSPQTIESFVDDYIKMINFFTLNPAKSYRDFQASRKKGKRKLSIK